MSKGGSQTTTAELPSWLEGPAQDALARGSQTAQLGYMPYTGADVAAFSPTQQAAFQNTNSAASAFGLAPSAGTGMPAPTQFAGGVQGYSSMPAFQQSVDQFAQMSPDQYAALMKLFVPQGYAPMPGGK